MLPVVVSLVQLELVTCLCQLFLLSLPSHALGHLLRPPQVHPRLHHHGQRWDRRTRPDTRRQAFCILNILFFVGGKRGHKGGRKQFTNPEELKQQQAKVEKEKEWRRQRGEDTDEDEDEEDSDDERKGAKGGARSALVAISIICYYSIILLLKKVNANVVRLIG